MTTVLDIKLVPKAKEMLEKFGMSVSYAQVSPGTYDPLARAVTGGSTATHPVKIVPPFPIKNDLVDGEVYKYGDMTSYIAAQDLPFTPVPGTDRVTIGSEQLTVIAARPIRSGDLVAVFELHLRKN